MIRVTTIKFAKPNTFDIKSSLNSSGIVECKVFPLDKLWNGEYV